MIHQAEKKRLGASHAARKINIELTQQRERHKAELQQRKARSKMFGRRCQTYVDLTQECNEPLDNYPKKEDATELVSEDEEDEDLQREILQRSSEAKRNPHKEAIFQSRAKPSQKPLPSQHTTHSTVLAKEKENDQVILLSSDDESRLKRKPRHSKLVGLPVSDPAFNPPQSSKQEESSQEHEPIKRKSKRKRSRPIPIEDDDIDAVLESVENTSREIASATRNHSEDVKPPLSLKLSSLPALPEHPDDIIVLSDSEDHKPPVQVSKEVPRKSGMKRVSEITVQSFYGKQGRGTGGVVGSHHIPELKNKPSDRVVAKEVVELELSDDESDLEPKRNQTGHITIYDSDPSVTNIKTEPPSDIDDRDFDIRFKGLNGEELTLVASLTSNVPKQLVLAKVEEANIELKGEDFGGLRGSRWLNDEIMNSFVSLVNARNRDEVRNKMNDVDYFDHESEVDLNSSRRSFFSRKRPRTHVFNTFFFARLSQNQYDYQGVRRWMSRAGLSIKELDLILVPINLKNFHWVLVGIDLRGKEFLYLDSTFGDDTSDAIPILKKWLYDEVKDKQGVDEADRMQIDSWRVTKNPGYLPRQRDGGSCGIFTLYMADYLERARLPNFDQNDIRNLRRRTVLFLQEGKLPS